MEKWNPRSTVNRYGNKQTLKDERSMDRLYRGHLTDLGALPLKIEAKHIAGLPDIYVAPDVWIECKKVIWVGGQPINLQSHFEPLQLHQLRKLRDHGASCFVVIFWWLGADLGAFVQTIEFDAFMARPKWYRDITLPYADPEQEMRKHVGSIFCVGSMGACSVRPAALSKVSLA